MLVVGPEAVGAGLGPGGRIHGAGEMAERVREYAWEQTTLGAINTWSDTLTGAVNSMLASPFASAIY